MTEAVEKISVEPSNLADDSARDLIYKFEHMTHRYLTITRQWIGDPDMVEQSIEIEREQDDLRRTLYYILTGVELQRY